MTTFRPDESFARVLDDADPLSGLREQFHIPNVEDVAASAKGGQDRSLTVSALKEPCVYLVGNSLGLQPKSTRAAIEQELDDWARLGVEGHLHGKHPWLPYHEEVREHLARVVGALPHEVVAMNSLTTNLHLLMVSFYRPSRERFKIVIEDTAFPSDSYAVQSQLDFHARAIGFNPRESLIRLKPREGEHTLRTDDILAAIDRENKSIALVMLGGVNYLTGQCFDMRAITRFAQVHGIVVGWDLAHAAGNIDVMLHDWNADFAAWCSYKYLNSGPGAIAGAFVHERHTRPGSPVLPRFAGWWGNDPATRFRMGPDFVPVASADAWQLSNPPILALAPLRESLAIFDRATMRALREKSRRLTEYFASLITHSDGGPTIADTASPNRNGSSRPLRDHLDILTPTNFDERGCQWSIALRSGDTRSLHAHLHSRGIVCDFREPNVIRAAPTPLYNTFHDVWRFASALRAAMN
jgi:kynureninase